MCVSVHSYTIGRVTMNFYSLPGHLFHAPFVRLNPTFTGICLYRIDKTIEYIPNTVNSLHGISWYRLKWVAMRAKNHPLSQSKSFLLLRLTFPGEMSRRNESQPGPSCICTHAFKGFSHHSIHQLRNFQALDAAWRTVDLPMMLMAVDSCSWI